MIHIFGDRENWEEKQNIRLFADEQGIRQPKIMDDKELIERIKSPERGIILVGHIEHTQEMLLHELSAHRIHHTVRRWEDDIEVINIWLHMPRVQRNTEELLLDALNSSEIAVKELIFVNDIFHQKWSLTTTEIKELASLASFATMMIENTHKDLDKLDIEIKEMLKKTKSYDKYAQNFHKFHKQKPSWPKGQYSNSRRK